MVLGGCLCFPVVSARVEPFPVTSNAAGSTTTIAAASTVTVVAASPGISRAAVTHGARPLSSTLQPLKSALKSVDGVTSSKPLVSSITSIHAIGDLAQGSVAAPLISITNNASTLTGNPFHSSSKLCFSDNGNRSSRNGEYDTECDAREDQVYDALLIGGASEPGECCGVTSDGGYNSYGDPYDNGCAGGAELSGLSGATAASGAVYAAAAAAQLRATGPLSSAGGPSQSVKSNASSWSFRIMMDLHLTPDRQGRLRLPSILMFTHRRPPRHARTQAWWTKLRGVLIDTGRNVTETLGYRSRRRARTGGTEDSSVVSGCVSAGRQSSICSGQQSTSGGGGGGLIVEEDDLCDRRPLADSMSKKRRSENKDRSRSKLSLQSPIQAQQSRSPSCAMNGGANSGGASCGGEAAGASSRRFDAPYDQAGTRSTRGLDGDTAAAATAGAAAMAAGTAASEALDSCATLPGAITSVTAPSGVRATSVPATSSRCSSGGAGSRSNRDRGARPAAAAGGAADGDGALPSGEAAGTPLRPGSGSGCDSCGGSLAPVEERRGCSQLHSSSCASSPSAASGGARYSRAGCSHSHSCSRSRHGTFKGDGGCGSGANSSTAAVALAGGVSMRALGKQPPPLGMAFTASEFTEAQPEMRTPTQDVRCEDGTEAFVYADDADDDATVAADADLNASDFPSPLCSPCLMYIENSTCMASGATPAAPAAINNTGVIINNNSSSSTDLANGRRTADLISLPPLLPSPLRNIPRPSTPPAGKMR